MPLPWVPDSPQESGTQDRMPPESIKNAISFDVIQKISKFPRKTLADFKKWGVFQRSAEHGHDKFSWGQAPGPPLLLASLAPCFSPPNMSFVPTAL